MKIIWSPEVRVMLRPISAYRQLADENSSGVWVLLKRPLFVTLIFASFISLTTSGRLTLPLVLGSALFWSAGTLLLVLTTSVVLIFTRKKISLPKAIDLFFTGHGPWLVWLLALSGICLFAPSEEVTLWPLPLGWLMLSSLGAFIWSSVTYLGFFRGALKLSNLRAVAAVVFYDILLWGTVLSYFLIMEILQPYVL